MDTLPSTFKNGFQPSTPDINPPRAKAMPPPNGSFSFIFQKSDLPIYSNIINFLYITYYIIYFIFI